MTRLVKFKALDDRAILPTVAYPGDLGMDFAIVGDHTLAPGESRDLPSGLAAEPPPGYGLRITGRSSTLREYGLFVNEGIIDGGYRGELKTYVTNRNAHPVPIAHGTRLAQLIPIEVVNCDTAWVDELSESERGTGGFGSTGAAGKPNGGAPEALGRPLVYLGGPVDYALPHNSVEPHGDWRHNVSWGDMSEFWCPPCRGKGKDPDEIMDANMRALARSAVAVFDLTLDHPSIGTPIEAWLKVNGIGRTILVHHQPPGIFVRHMEHLGAVVVPDFSTAWALAREFLRGH